MKGEVNMITLRITKEIQRGELALVVHEKDLQVVNDFLCKLRERKMMHLCTIGDLKLVMERAVEQEKVTGKEQVVEVGQSSVAP